MSLEENRQATMRILACSKKWWENHRPVKWNLQEHLENPTVNMTNKEDGALATAVADAVRRCVI